MREMLKAAEYGWKTISAIHSSIDFQESGMPSTAEALEGISYVTARVAARHGALALLSMEQDAEFEQDYRQGVVPWSVR